MLIHNKSQHNNMRHVTLVENNFQIYSKKLTYLYSVYPKTNIFQAVTFIVGNLLIRKYSVKNLDQHIYAHYENIHLFKNKVYIFLRII